MYLNIILIIIGFILLVKGADFLIDGASNLAKRFHIPEIVIGLTVVSIGTSLPELFISTSSVIEGHYDMAVGNVIGSNINNLLLVLGLTAIFKAVKIKRETRLIEIPICLLFTGIFIFLCNNDKVLSVNDGIILLCLFISFIMFTIFMAFKGEKFDSVDEEKKRGRKPKAIGTIVRDIMHLIIGIVGLKFGGDFVVNNAVDVARLFELDEKVIGVTILAIGTSLPELVTSIDAALKNDSDLAIGNILGSCIFNLLLIMGVSAIITPVSFNPSFNTDLMLLFFSTFLILIFPFIPIKNEIGKLKGSIYLIMYIIYLYYLF